MGNKCFCEANSVCFVETVSENGWHNALKVILQFLQVFSLGTRLIPCRTTIWWQYFFFYLGHKELKVMCWAVKLHRFTDFLLLDVSHGNHTHPGRSRRQRQMLLLWWGAEELGARRWPLAGTRQVVSKVRIHHLSVFTLCQVIVYIFYIQQHLSNSQMWVFNPVERAGLYQQRTGCSFPSGWDCGESLYPLLSPQNKIIWHTW